MIKIFNSTDRDFSTNGNLCIFPLKCIEKKAKSLNGWYLSVEVDIKYKSYIKKDALIVTKTKSMLNPQAFRVAENIEYTQKVLQKQIKVLEARGLSQKSSSFVIGLGQLFPRYTKKEEAVMLIL